MKNATEARLLTVLARFRSNINESPCPVERCPYVPGKKLRRHLELVHSKEEEDEEPAMSLKRLDGTQRAGES